MEILRNIPVPTGNILIVQGDRGKLECLSLGDYGKAVNLVEKPVQHTSLLPLEEKWVITISTQYGCSMKCLSCDVPVVGTGKNATLADLTGQVWAGRWLHPDVQQSKRLNIHFARMGEPTWNPNVLDAALYLRTLEPQFHVHPVVSTMMPKRNIWLKAFLREWMRIKNEVYQGEAGLQLSINSTSEEYRKWAFSNNTLTLKEISELTKDFRPKGRKITLNFAVAEGSKIDPFLVGVHFNPDHFICKLTPMHRTVTAEANNIRTAGDYTQPESYQRLAEGLRKQGFEVLVFIASREEDEGRITCGNAILSGAEPFGAGVQNMREDGEQ